MKICDGKSKYLIVIGILTILIIIAITLGTTVSLSKGATTIIEESQNIRGKGSNLEIRRCSSIPHLGFYSIDLHSILSKKSKID